MLDYYAKQKYQPQNSPHFNKEIRDVFTTIYTENSWGNTDSVSGHGSDLNWTENAVQGIVDVVRDYKIKTIADIPCGDFNWMQKVLLEVDVDYLGADIVPAIIDANNTQYAGKSVQFQLMDVIEDELPSFDLVIIRDCWVHFSFDQIKRSIQNLRRSGAPYVLITSFPGQSINYDITTGDWRPLNLEKKPFHFPPPLKRIEENKVPGYENDFRGKSLSLWRTDQIPEIS